jgi:hypothetical protein
MTKPTDSLAKVTHTVVESAEKLRLALAREWQAAVDGELDEAHGATLQDRPSAGYHPCEPEDVTIASVLDADPGAEPDTDPTA